MADDPTQDPTTNNDPPKPGDPDPSGSGDPPAEEWDRDRAMDTIRKQREAEKELRKKNAEETEALKAELKALKDAQLSAEELKANRLAEREEELREKDAQLQDQALRLAVYGLKDELRIADVDLALAALSKDADLGWQDGKPTKVKDAIEALLDDKPILRLSESTGGRSGGSSDGGAGSGGSSGGVQLSAEEMEWVTNSGTTPEAYARAKKVGSLEEFMKTREPAQT